MPATPAPSAATSVRGRLRTAILIAVIVVEAVVAVSSSAMVVGAWGRVVEAGDLPADAPRTLIVLGSKVTAGEPGDYVRPRLDVAVAAYRAGRVERIIDSGNDADEAGNEVAVMRRYLEARGVPAAAIVDDRFGLNTDATCRRAAGEFGVTAAMIVTQNFHVARAVALCRARGIDTLGVIAPCGSCSTAGLTRNHLRESLASRPRALLDAMRARLSR
ncbi:SanA/YdcF family protein [Gordonia shandongensis]|uniref:SanA/YdcF family protein n=1 Tax=Gordonia shandongensis TaxID=376351 RepID=UPI000421E75E|nr:ElyC/SanA/YdcF family protein [Gordonia shandongensis]